MVADTINEWYLLHIYYKKKQIVILFLGVPTNFQMALANTSFQISTAKIICQYLSGKQVLEFISPFLYW